MDIENQYYNSKGALTGVHSACKLLGLDTYSVCRLRLSVLSLLASKRLLEHTLCGQPS